MTGKTTYLAHQIEAAVSKRGAGAVIVASFTRAAAAELVSRNLSISRDRVGTLHAHAFRALGHPIIAESKLDVWNQEHGVGRELSGGRRGTMDESEVDQVGGTDTDKLLQRYNSLRARMVPVEHPLWTDDVKGFANDWMAWKDDHAFLDFTDLIHYAIKNTDHAPGGPEVGFYDEVQDFTRLELSLVRHWGKAMETIVLAGDDDQCLYAFKGATPDAFLSPELPADHKRVLPKSYRLPVAIQDYATTWVKRLTRREMKEFAPRDEVGYVGRLVKASEHDADTFNFRQPDGVIDDAEKWLASGATVMFLTTCGYMLDPIKEQLRQRGLPFHNPYRRSRGDWNPLQVSRGVGSVERLLAYLRPQNSVWGKDARMWDAPDLETWTAALKATEIFLRGGKVRLGKIAPGAEIDVVQLLNILTDDGVTRSMEGDLDWFEDHLLAARSGPMEFPLAVARKRGGLALRETPKIVLGTIHSVKGGEADVVYLFPDVSSMGIQEWDAGRTQRDAVIRQFYVGMTRARKALFLCTPATRFAVPLLSSAVNMAKGGFDAYQQAAG